MDRRKSISEREPNEASGAVILTPPSPTFVKLTMRILQSLPLLLLSLLLLPRSSSATASDVKDRVLRYTEVLRSGQEARIEEFLPEELRWMPNYLRELATKNPGPGPLRGVCNFETSC